MLPLTQLQLTKTIRGILGGHVWRFGCPNIYHEVVTHLRIIISYKLIR
jgi:hypothetical protein